MPIKIAFIGAGALYFTRSLMRDLLCVPEFQDTEFALTDISEFYLDVAYQLSKRDIEAAGLPTKVTASLDRREALKGANYLFCTIRAGGTEAFGHDIEIPLKYGVDQSIGDTLCAGGIMDAQKAIYCLLEFCKDISEVAKPDCLLLNYANPMAMNTWACNKYGYGVKVVGLCHGVEGGEHQIADALGIPHKELEFLAGGINHQTWFVSIKHKGKELKDELLAAMEGNPKFAKSEKCRIDVLRRFGYWSTESNGHLSEYLPWYRKRSDDIQNWIDMGNPFSGETGIVLRMNRQGKNSLQEEFPKMMQKPPQTFRPEDRGMERGSRIIEALELGTTYRLHFNVVNNGCITNLPDDAIVEVPGYVDRHGISIPRFGDLPLGCAAVCNASISTQRLAVEAAVHGDDTLLRQAMMMDPLTGAVCSPPEIWQTVDELLVAEAPWLPQYKKAIAAARKRLKNGTLLPLREYKPAYAPGR